MTIKIIISIICMALSIVLMILPYGVAIHWGVSSTEVQTTYTSYFSFLPAGYADWFPLTIAVLAIVSLLLYFIAFLKKEIVFIIRCFLIICVVLSILSWIIFNSFTWIAFAVMILHVIVCFLSYFVVGLGNR